MDPYGDINWHSVRNKDFTKIVEEFVEKVELCSVWEKFPVSHTHIDTDHKSFSTLDHFLLDPELLEVVEQAEALHIALHWRQHIKAQSRHDKSETRLASSQAKALGSAGRRPDTRQQRDRGRSTHYWWRRS